MTNLLCHPGSSRRRLIGSIALVCAAMLVACGDDDSSFATRPSDGSSSSAKSSSSSAESSSSVTLATPCKTDSTDTCEYGELVDDRDGQTYKTVKIGDQWWMAENLNYEVDSSFCYNDSAEYCGKFGRLYRWAAAVGKSERECGHGYTCSLPSGNIQGVCPSGWHLPNSTEWQILFNAVGGWSTAGTKLKSTSGWKGSRRGTDAFGFSALPAGNRSYDGSFDFEGSITHVWSSTELGRYSAYSSYLYYYDDDAHLFEYSKDSAFPVRCIQD